MNRQSLQCIGTSTVGRSETKDSLVTQLNAVCAGEPIPNESVHNESRPKAKPVHKAAGKDQTASKTTSTRSSKAKLNSRSSTGGHAISQVQPHKHERESGCGTVKQTGSAAQSQSPVTTGSASHASILKQTRPALRSSVAAEQVKVQVGATGAAAASCTPHRVCVHNPGASESQAKHQRDETPSEEEEERCDDDDEGSVRSAPLGLLAEFLKAVMEKDYPLSQKLCHMILIYEPENPEAKLFMPLIEERLLIAQEAEEQRKREEGTGCSSEEDDDDDHSSDDDDDDDDSDDDDEEDSDDDGEESTDDSESSSSSSSGEDNAEDELERRGREEQERCKRAVVIL